MQGRTTLAIRKFYQLRRLEHRVHKVQAELDDLVPTLPEDDMAEYVRVTQQIEGRTCRYCKPARLYCGTGRGRVPL